MVREKTERTLFYQVNKMTTKEIREALESGDQQVIDAMQKYGVLDIYYENLEARPNFKSVGVRNLQKAIGMQAMMDYVKADAGYKIGPSLPEEAKEECKNFFKTPIFKAMWGETDYRKVIRGLKRYEKLKEELADLPEAERTARINQIIRKKEAI